MLLSLNECLLSVFNDKMLFGFSQIDSGLMDKTGCKCALVTLLPFPDLVYSYNPIEFYCMLEDLRAQHNKKLLMVKQFLDDNKIHYAAPSASPKEDGEYFAEFSYKWAAINAGLGYIGKNDVFVSYKYAQRVRISCLLLDFDAPVFSGEIISKCGACTKCVDACPHNLISGDLWQLDKKRSELIDYKKCGAKSNHGNKGQKYLCANCVMVCTYKA